MNYELKRYGKCKPTPELQSLEERAKNIVIKTVNLAKHRVGIRQELDELADGAAYAWEGHRLNLSSIVTPIAITGEEFITKTIEKDWQLTDVFKYHLQYMGETCDEVSHYYYFEAIFSQPTAAYPIPQATGSVFFKIEDKHTEKEKAPVMWFRIEGDATDHDVRYVAPTPDWILALIQKKMIFFKRIETIKLF
ncbi:unnamed protein product [Arctia plantaginis]|uniref:Uncharacterized protein n=1 Tax=Arctia plantaginis TaxID=874455 RepID=A0A8S0ZDS5_ARCPL|nr:unnamed protein product [Arctia plantaginis]CAB3257341.1 unnamed protein product [Arctia plantaginis]